MARAKRAATTTPTNEHPKGSAASVQAALDRLGALFDGGDTMARKEPERLIRFAHHLLVSFRGCGDSLEGMGSALSQIGATIAGRPPAHLSAAWLKRGKK